MCLFSQKTSQKTPNNVVKHIIESTANHILLPELMSNYTNNYMLKKTLGLLGKFLLKLPIV